MLIIGGNHNKEKNKTQNLTKFSVSPKTRNFTEITKPIERAAESLIENVPLFQKTLIIKMLILQKSTFPDDLG